MSGQTRHGPRRRRVEVTARLAGADREWLDDIACKFADPRLFDPADDNEVFRRYPRRAVEAARFCWECPVRDACYTDAVEGRDRGVRGGFWMGRQGPVPIVPLPRRRRAA